MAQQIRLEFISAGFKEILESDGVRNVIEDTTKGIQQRANANITGESEGFNASVKLGNYGGGRWLGFVGTNDQASRVAESENGALTKAVR